MFEASQNKVLKTTKVSYLLSFITIQKIACQIFIFINFAYNL